MQGGERKKEIHTVFLENLNEKGHIKLVDVRIVVNLILKK
jgi:hypothetical protein